MREGKIQSKREAEIFCPPTFSWLRWVVPEWRAGVLQRPQSPAAHADKAVHGREALHEAGHHQQQCSSKRPPLGPMMMMLVLHGPH